MKKNILLVVSIFSLLYGCSSENLSSNTNSSQESSQESIATSNSLSTSSLENSTYSTTTSSSSSSPSSSFSTLDEKGTMDFDEVLDLLSTPIVNEALYASSAQIKDTTYNGDITIESDEKHQTFADYTAYVEGTVTSEDKSSAEIKKTTDTYKRRQMSVQEKIEEENKLYTFNMYENVIDFEKNSLSGNAYQDAASKIFIFDSQEEADDSMLTENSYILDSAYKIETSPKAAYKTQLFIRTIQSNAYFMQLGNTTMSYTKTNEEYNFSFTVSYSYDGDWGEDIKDKITDTISLEFSLSLDLSKILSVNYSFVSNDVLTEDDSYLSGYAWQAEVNYEERKTVPSDIMDTTEYFLETVSEVQMIARNNGDHAVDSNKITLDTSYLFADAKSYTPNKALSLRLNNVGSSNSSVVELENDGFLHVVGKGTTTLTFSYYKKCDDGIFRYTLIEEEVTITAPAPTSVSFHPSDSIEGDTLLIGQVYNYRTYVMPMEADQTIIATSSDENKLEVTVDENNTLILTPKEVGDVVITIKSSIDENIVASKTFHIMSNEIDFKSIITTKTYIYSTYQYTMTLEFKEDGTGSVTQLILSSEKTYVDTFEYTLKDNKISFSNWNLDAFKKYDEATILEDGNKISCYEEETYTEHVYNVQ